jgi:FixJ family two-component response regulator
LSDGATCFLAKPFDSATLIKCIEAALEIHRDASSP